jgi:hypothetical protein
MRPTKPPATFTIVSLEEAFQLTGLSHTELRAERNVQALTRVLPDGRREQAIRLPVELIVNNKPT